MKKKKQNKTKREKTAKGTFSLFPLRQLFACLSLSRLPHYLRTCNRLFQEKLQTMLMQNLMLAGGVGEANKVYYGRYANNEYSILLHLPGAPNGNFRENICSEDDLRSRAFVVKFLACLPLLGFSNIYKMV